MLHWHLLCIIYDNGTIIMNSPYRNRSAKKISSHQLNNNNGGRKKQTIVSSLLRYPKIIFVVIIFSWVGFVSLSLSRMQSESPHSDKVSPLSARDNYANRRRQTNTNDGKTATPSKNRQRKHGIQREDEQLLSSSAVRGRIVDAIMINLGLTPNKRRNMGVVSHRHSSNDDQKRRFNANHAVEDDIDIDKKERIHYTRQSLGLGLSDLHVQKSTDESASLFSTKSLYAFAAEDYLDATTNMGDDNDDTLDTYYAIDDDIIRGSGYKKWYDDDTEPVCKTPAYYRIYKPTCNDLHSTVSGYQWLIGDENARSRYLASGAYRQVFILEQQFTSDEVIFKSMKRFQHGRTFEQRLAFNPDETYKNYELYDDMRKDSMVMELLSSSPRIADIYQFCGLSSIIEFVAGNIEKQVLPTHGKKNDDDVNDNDDPTPVNNIKPQKKLEMAMELALVIATIHGHKDGVIATADIQVSQFSRGTDGSLKMLDFNRAEAMLYDDTHNRYCRFENGVPPDGTLRAPEEIIDAPLTEAIDVYALGNVFFSVLTGLFVNGEYSVSQAHARLLHGKTDHINVSFFESRSPAELTLVKAIQWMWTFNADERPSIFEVVKFLEDEYQQYYYSEKDTYRR